VVEEVSSKFKREMFFKLLFGRNRGYLCLSFLDTSDKRNMREFWFTYPDDLDQALECVEQYGADNHAYFCPQLFAEKKRKKEYVSLTTNAWSDLDRCNPDNMLIPPSVVIESSPNRYQAYWLFDPSTTIDPKDAEDLSKRIAYYHEKTGADTSGWDLTQLLRVPDTFNFKYPDVGNMGYPVVKIREIKKLYYRMDEFKDYPLLPGYDYIDAEFPVELPQESGEQILEKVRREVSPLVIKLFTEVPPEHKWSEKLWQLELLLFEAGFPREKVFIIARDAACNKYSRDKRASSQLWKEVCRAEQAAQLKKNLPIEDYSNVETLMTRAETELVAKLPKGFVEHYIDWASSLGDAAYQYHQAGAFILLSAILCGSVKLPTSFGNIYPNLWFMILADTTLTRKTTSMDIAMELLEEVDPNTILATDGSIEGMFTSLSLRPNQPSIFLRDEFSGLIESMAKKDYMAGMPEMLTKLYDGKLQKRILRKEIIEVRDPRLIIFGGGIKNRVTSAVTFDHVASGFLPRFIFITAESDVSKIKPLGPPTQKITLERGIISAELKEIYDHYNGVRLLHFAGADAEIESKKEFDAYLTDDAWERYNKLEFKLVELGTQSALPDIYTPIGDRLSKSILKAAVLIASARQRDNDTVLVELQDILRAIKYGEQWRAYSQEIIENVGKSTTERKLDTILESIRKRGNEGASRSRIMRTFKLSSREAVAVFDTLVDRGIIEKKASGDQFLYYARD